MTPERWQQIREAFEAVHDVPESARGDALVQRCGHDAELLDEVARMLGISPDDSRLQPTGVVQLGELVARTAEYEVREDLEIDRYRIVHRLGEGGMGVVYEAERADGAFEKTVAIKVLKRGMDTDLFLRRFDAERGALARLDHPNIATMLDGGSTADGRPYLVMELVTGEPLNTYCDARNMSLRDRVRVFLQVCAAVSHAHQNLVLHRDLKPSNIFVTPDGQVKLLDFGIAKVLDPGDNERTITTEQFMTPRYASPELVDGQAVTTTSDVYSLGVILYELLTGQEPYDLTARTPREYEAAIRDQVPMSPSTAVSRTAGGDSAPNRGSTVGALSRALRGDLDVILLKALRKEPGRRHESVERLADDLRAYLDGLPVSARPDSSWYRARKFIGRHPWELGLGSAAAIVLVGLTIYSVIQRGRAEQASEELGTQLAEVTRQKAIVEGVSAFYTEGVLGQANPRTSGVPDMTVTEALDRASVQIDDEFGDAPLVEAKIRNSIAYFHHVRSDYDKALVHAKRAWDLYATELEPTDHDVLIAKRDYANCLTHLGRYDESLPLLEEVLDAQRRAYGPDDGYTLLTLSLVGGVLKDMGKLTEAEPFLREAYEGRLAAWGERHSNTLTSMNNLAEVYYRLGQLDRAEPFVETTARVREEEFGRTHPLTLIARANLATLRSRIGRQLQAIEQLEAVRVDQLNVIGDTHDHTLHVLRQLIRMHDEQGNTARATALSTELVTACAERYGDDDQRTIDARTALAARENLDDG